MNLERLLEPEIIVFLVPIVLFIVGGAIVIAWMVIRHRERLAMIERGINPNLLDEEPPEGKDKIDQNPAG